MNINIQQKLSFLLIALVSVMGFASLMAPAWVGADPVTEGINATCDGGSCEQVDENGDPISAQSIADGIVGTIIDIFSWIVGVVSVIMVIFGGFRYITSGGDSGKVTSAKNTIVYALVGLAIVALAQVLVLFVLNKIT